MDSHKVLKMTGSNLLKTVAAACLATVLGSGYAMAGTCNMVNFTTSTQCDDSLPSGSGASGNVDADVMNDQANSGTNSIFGISGWSELAELNAPDSIVSGSTTQSTGTPYLFSVTYGSPDPGKNGTWTLNPTLTFGSGSYAFVIKGAQDNAAYLMDTSTTSGTWNVNDLANSGGNPDMSNIRLFGTTGLTVVPLPAAAWLMFAAFGGLGVAGAVKKRRTPAQKV